MGYKDLLSGYQDVLLPREVQEILRTGRNTVYDYLDKGIIKSIKVGGRYKIPKKYLLEFMFPEMDFTEMEGG